MPPPPCLSHQRRRTAGTRGETIWVGFPRIDSSAWYGEITAILRSHGMDLVPTTPGGQGLLEGKPATTTSLSLTDRQRVQEKVS